MTLFTHQEACNLLDSFYSSCPIRDCYGNRIIIPLQNRTTGKVEPMFLVLSDSEADEYMYKAVPVPAHIELNDEELNAYKKVI